MKEWVKCFYFDINKPSGVFPCVSKTFEIAIVLFRGEKYDIPIEYTRVIDSPKFDYGDLVSPANHLEIDGTIDFIDYHFDRKDHILFKS